MVSKVGLKTVFASFVAALALYAPVPSAGEQSDKTAAAQATNAARPALDYEFFKARVQPIFLKTRSEDHVRCYACHQVPRHPAGLHLELLLPGQNTWTEEQSRRNFETVSKLVVPGAPLSSLFLLMPLVPEVGGMADGPNLRPRQLHRPQDRRPAGGLRLARLATKNLPFESEGF